jgi:peptidoglycan-associated lipoprotein
MTSGCQRHILNRLAVGFAAAAVLVAGAAGCSHAKPTVAAAPEPAPPPASAPAPAPEVQPAVTEAPTPPAPTVVKTESVYFDTDRDDLNPAGQAFLSEFGALLAKHPDLHVRIEGNCDERGTAQYNLALGYRRAEAAKKYLLQMGARDDQVKTVSFGKERPRAKGHGEAAWKENRRDDFIADHETLPVAENP